MWRHRSIADSRPGQVFSGALEICPVGQILRPPSFCRQPDLDAVPPSFQHDKTPGAAVAATVSH
jgi:hypothetical protein